jgi:hypothetical protein
MTLDTVFLICALLGGTLLVGQFVLSLFGLGGGHDVDADHGDVGGGEHDVHHGEHAHDEPHDHATAWYVGILTLRSLVAAVTFFGLGGLAASGGGERGPFLSLAVAFAAGLGALFLVGSIMRALHKLKAEGTIRYDRAVGSTGTVYLTVPGNRKGTGKVTVTMQNRTMELHAVTAASDLPTGTKVVVLSVVSPGTVEVAPAPTGAPTHT